MQFRILGSIGVGSGAGHEEFGPPKQRALLAVLLLHPNELVPTDRLVDLLWGEQAPRTARHSVQTYVSDLRRVLDLIAGKPVIVTRTLGYELRTDPDAIDAHKFERLVVEGMQKLGANDWVAGTSSLRAALDLWRGPALADFAYEEFAQPYIQRWNELHLAAIEALAGSELAAGRAEAVLPLLEEAVREDPLRERLRELLMLALYRSGRQAEALRAYQALRSLLADELGVDPSPPLRRLQERIVVQDETLMAEGAPTPRPRVEMHGSGNPIPAPSTPVPPTRRRVSGLALAVITLTAAVGLGAMVAAPPRRGSVALLFHGGDYIVSRIVEQGFDSVVSEFGLLGRKVVVEPVEAQNALSRLAADGTGLVVVHALETDVDGPATEHPATKFASFYPTLARNNVTQLDFGDNEGSFLVGAAAALTSRTGTIGFIGGVDNETIWAFEAGYEAGAQAVKPGIRVEARYLSTPPDYSGFYDPAAAARVARELYGGGAPMSSSGRQVTPVWAS